MPNNEDDRTMKALIAGALAGREDLYAQPPEPLGATRAEAEAHPPIDLSTAVTLREARPGDPPPREWQPREEKPLNLKRSRQTRETPDTIAQPTLPPNGHEFWGLTREDKELYLAIQAIAQSDAEVWLETITDERERAAFAAHPWTAALLAIEQHGMDDAIHRLVGKGAYYGDRTWIELGGALDVVRPEAIRALTWYDSAVRLAFDKAIDRSPAERLMERMSRAPQGVDE